MNVLTLLQINVSSSFLQIYFISSSLKSSGLTSDAKGCKVPRRVKSRIRLECLNNIPRDSDFQYDKNGPLSLMYLSVERLRWEPRTKEGRTFRVKRMIWGFFLVLGDTENQLTLAVLFAIPFPSSCDLCSRTRANSSARRPRPWNDDILLFPRHFSSLTVHSKSERSVLALKTGPFR